MNPPGDSNSKPNAIISPTEIIGRWLVLSFFGMVVGNLLNNLLPLGSIIFLPTLVAGFSLAGFQWLLLRRFIPQPRPWLVTATAAFFLATLTITILGPAIFETQILLDNQLLAAIILEAIFGLIYGLGQWMILRPYLRHSLLWVVATIVGWTLGLVLLHFDNSNGFFRTFAQLMPTGLALGKLLNPDLLRPADTPEAMPDSTPDNT